MQLQKWSTVNKRYFASRSGPSEKEWQAMIRDGIVNGRILGTLTYIDIDQIAAFTELPSQSTEEAVPDLLA
ncbi:hypothetical protein [Marinobacterium lutimaris]|uniref:Uncharacterized protein n=1 Tax=Marinobacterium lutimaris TaxID=568106 RepID=A0A1H5XQD3_9GAMM|nr:hypothetical protein [Marinobacterium lutimaris]SEG13961.1 hypothetical protein SAMN05444390_1011466 [Marinobacterium lutimaris]